jgi:hypothetical protein
VANKIVLAVLSDLSSDKDQSATCSNDDMVVLSDPRFLLFGNSLLRL